MKEEKVSIPSNGVHLEGLLSIHEAFRFGKGLFVACHPHPLYGGEMRNPVVEAAVKAAHEEGFSTLRFNFRGVGESEGDYDEGRGEREDVVAAVDFLWERQRGSESPLVLMGYSFGAWVGAPVALEDGRIQGLIAVAPPLAMYDFGFLQACPKKKLIIVGDQDPYCPLEKLRAWFDGLEEPKVLRLLKGADHFLLSQGREIIPAVREFLREFFLSC
jgi:alpha/beta superfamily hydrolase